MKTDVKNQFVEQYLRIDSVYNIDFGHFMASRHMFNLKARNNEKAKGKIGVVQDANSSKGN